MIIGIVLTGGGSRRMGQDKAELVLGNGWTSGRAVTALLRPHVDDVVVVGNPLTDEQTAVLDDPRDGPLVAVAAAARENPGAALLICTCDAPFVPPSALTALAACPGSAGLAGPDGPLVFPARIAASDALALSHAVDGGERRARWLIAQRTTTISIEAETAERCLGANTSEQWRAMCALYGETRDDPA